ncbi:hypothetical protein I7X12_15935 [Halosimplex litoreum]|uniref:Uncharacterized protein n=1 Tax=Halosimplex litoreum TaxID=1198301 RepID=A0A7T3FX03_9EURY|nr:hypothetical protein [Halosimplex litoreum]QPV62216.1 hypothetical protein I7X12_15935 [Halosimplex litoreum]
MVSRDTSVHLVVVALAMAGLTAALWLPSDPAVMAVAFAGYNATVLAGAHLYLAWRGEDGLVPVASRWRFVAAVAAVLSLVALAAFTDPVSIGPVSSDAVLRGSAAVVALTYLVVEARDGYRESLETPL